MIRVATHEDVPEVVRLGAEFLAYSVHKEWPLDPEAFAVFAGRLIDGGVIYLSDDGMLGGMLNPLYFNPAIVLGCELFWWARKDAQALRVAFEDWCRAKGAVGVNFTGMRDERAPAVERIYSRAGYVATETGFLKRF